MDKLKIALTIIIGFLSYIFGGLDLMLKILIIMAIIDYITGFLAGLYNKELSSVIGYKGIIKKVLMFLMVAVANIIGILTNLDFIRATVISFYIANEGLSIIENVARTGLKLPQKLIEVLYQLKEGDNSDNVFTAR